MMDFQMWWWKMSYIATDSKNEKKPPGNLIWYVILDK